MGAHVVQDALVVHWVQVLALIQRHLQMSGHLVHTVFGAPVDACR